MNASPGDLRPKGLRGNTYACLLPDLDSDVPEQSGGRGREEEGQGMKAKDFCSRHNYQVFLPITMTLLADLASLGQVAHAILH